MYKKIWAYIKNKKQFTICTHVNPDGDTIGSAYALKELLLINIPNSTVKISSVEKIPTVFKTIDESEIVSDEYFNNSQVIVVDTADKHRVADKRVILNETINIDHHHNSDQWMIRIGGDHWPATGQVIYEMINELKLKTNEKIDLGLFIAIWTDTEGMTQRNISNATIKAVKKLGKNNIKEQVLKILVLPESVKQRINDIFSKVIVKNNISYIIYDHAIDNNYFRQIIGELSNRSETEVFLALIMQNKNTYRGSLRSKGNIDVSVLAKHFGGGGHYSSSGFTTDSIKKENVIEYSLEYVNKANK